MTTVFNGRIVYIVIWYMAEWVVKVGTADELKMLFVEVPPIPLTE